ncbi:MAG: hypothetical protein MRJ96_13535 [Nitrospirales bacterium]|nr:hypothetical protein [Nitrospira sp.]MDR4502467.1 hypothetical protein [Nitrospirales bacterium]
MTNQTKGQILAALLLVWGGAVLFQYLDESEQSDSFNTHSQGVTLQATAGSLAIAKSFANPRQHIELGTPRNIFSTFHPRSTSPQPAKKPKAPPARITPKQEAPRAVTPPLGPDPVELARQRARQQLQQFRFLGYLKKGGESQAFLSNGQSIYIVKQGTTVDNHILVYRIDPTIVTLSTKILNSGDYVKVEIPLTKDAQNS